MDERLRVAGEAAIGFLHPEEGLALYAAAMSAPPGPILEIGAYCGKSAVYLGAAARDRGSVLYSVDHHRGSDEHQPGGPSHNPALAGPDAPIETFPIFRRTIEDAGLTDVVVPIVAASPVAARDWSTSLALVFIDGGHSQAAVDADYAGWAPHVAPDGLLAIHDVYEDAGDVPWRPPYVVYRRAIESGDFAEVSRAVTLRVARRIAASG